MGERKRIFTVLIRRPDFKYAQCHPGSCLSRFFTSTHRALLWNLVLRLSEEKRLLMKLCGSERPELGLRCWRKVNTNRELFELSIIIHNFPGKLFHYSYLENRRLPSQWCTVNNISLNKAGSVRITCIEARSRNHCCRRKAIIITYAECVSVDLVIQHANPIFSAPLYIVFSDLSGSTIFSHIISWTAQFSGKSCWTYNACFDFLCNVCLKHFLF
jgi:hypothetical protein